MCARLVLELLVLLGVLGKVAKDVVEDEVAIGLLSEDKCLGESLMWLALVGDLADDLDDDVGIGALRVDIGDADLGVFVFKTLDAIIDGLSHVRSAMFATDGSDIPSGLHRH